MVSRFFFLFDIFARNPKISWSLTFNRLASSRLKILTTCTQDFFFSSCVTVIYVTYPKNILQPHFHGSSRLKKNFHSHKGPFFSSRVTIICVTYPKNILQPRFHAGPTYPLYYCHENNSLASRIETCQSRLWKK